MILKMTRQAVIQEKMYYFPVHLLPFSATPIEVIGLTEALEAGMEISYLDRHFSSIDILSTIKAAEELGLARKEGSFVSLTDLGIGFTKASDGKAGIIRMGLVRVEPFKTMLEILKKRKSITPHELSQELEKKSALLSVSEDSLRTLLIEWGISSSLLDYDGKAFRLARK